MDELRKWGGLFLLVVGLILGVSGVVVLLMEDSGKVGGAVTLVLGVVAVTGGVLVNRQGERQIAVAERENRMDALRAQAARAAHRGSADTPAALAEIGEKRVAALHGMARDGRLPLDPVEAGLACATCGVEAELREVQLSRHTGMLIVRETQDVCGRLCRPCIESIATAFNSHNLRFGWWGATSFLGTLLALPTNASHRRAAARMVSPGADAVPPELSPAVIARLNPAAAGLADALAEGKDPHIVYRVASEKFGVSAGEVVLFAAALAERGRGR